MLPTAQARAQAQAEATLGAERTLTLGCPLVAPVPIFSYRFARDNQSNIVNNKLGLSRERREKGLAGEREGGREGRNQEPGWQSLLSGCISVILRLDSCLAPTIHVI